MNKDLVDTTFDNVAYDQIFWHKGKQFRKIDDVWAKNVKERAKYRFAPNTKVKVKFILKYDKG